MKKAALMAVMTFALVAAVNAQQVVDTSSPLKNGERVLQQSITVDAPAEEIWQLVSTAEGLRKFAAPNLEFELKSGGRWLASFDPKAKLGDSGIHNQVISFVPGRMLSIQIGFPAGTADEVRASNAVFAVVTLEPIGAKRTRVIETMSGFGKGSAWDATFVMFKQCNQQTLEALRIAAQTHRSIDWNGTNPYSNHHHGGTPSGIEKK